MRINKKGKRVYPSLSNRKSQAALEFLMTYGWAILVVLIAIGALAYFGVLSPARFLPTAVKTPILIIKRLMRSRWNYGKN